MVQSFAVRMKKVLYQNHNMSASDGEDGMPDVMNAAWGGISDDTFDPAKLQPIIFDPVNLGYHVIGERIGNAFRDGKELK